MQKIIFYLDQIWCTITWVIILPQVVIFEFQEPGMAGKTASKIQLVLTATKLYFVFGLKIF